MVASVVMSLFPALTVLALAGGIVARPAMGQEPLRVFAAASLTDAFRVIAADFEAASETRVELSFAGSQVLRTQIEQGAPADVFAFADVPTADALRNAGHTTRHEILARNGLTVVVPATGARVTGLADLARRGVKVVVAGTTVPAGRYTRQALEKLAASGAYGKDWQARVDANIVSHETNVRLVLAKVVLGEADAGFVYSTDAHAVREQVGIIALPDRDNVMAEYPIGLVERRGRHPKAAAFLKHVLGPAGQKVLRDHGFR